MSRKHLILGVCGLIVPCLALATIQDQRARLPPAPDPAECLDEIQGTWRSHAYYPRQREWSDITLEVRRAGNTLSGTIDARFWSGPESRPEPIECQAGHADWTVREPAVGTYFNGDIEFRAQSFTVSERRCGRGPVAYILDTFLGRLDPSTQEFVSVNRYPMNGVVVEDSNLFRRVACVPRQAAPAPETVPAVVPAVEPKRTGSCSRR